ncbi:hypothetical protein M8J77_014292 [Diaphorina citri]|jgi:FOG: Ankyrin repeat|nr:hypothetical protein M8J77_014292 [Diaphorina citri]
MELDVKKNTLDRSRSFNNDTRFPLALMRSKTSKSYSTKKAMFNQLNDEKPTMVDNMRTDSLEETISDELSYKVCKESIRASLLEAMKMSSGDVNVLYAIENSLYEPDEMATLFSKASQAEKTTALLWCVFVKREDLLDALHQLGADLSNDKYGALHLAAFNGSIKGCSWLMLHGHDINFTKDSYTPLHFAVLGNYVDCAKFLIKNKAHIHETIVHSAVSTNAVDCVQLLLSLQINPNVLNNKGVSPLHIAADRGLISCLKAILDSGMADVDIKTKERRVTALHLAAENGYVECLRILLENHANCNERNHKEQIPLHLAAKCQSVECMEMLLRKGSQVNASDCDNRTPLHASLSKNILSVHPLEILLKWGANVNARDIFGYSPIHIAALSELSQCVDCLIMHGADISSKTPSGSSALSIIMRNTPSSISSVRKKLDSSISLQDPEASTKDIELKLNFKYILQNGPDGEIGMLKIFQNDGQKEILEHPLCEAFLYVKWEKMKKFYLFRLVLSSIFVLVLSVYVLTTLAQDCYNASKNITLFTPTFCTKNSEIGHFLLRNPDFMETVWYVLALLATIELIRKIFGLVEYASFREYCSHVTNLFEWYMIISVFLISCVYTKRTYIWQNHVGAVAVLLGWSNLMGMIGQLPSVGTYVAMFSRVQLEFLKLFQAYICLLVGFTLTFCIVFPSEDRFQNPIIGFINILVMMTGELNVNEVLLGTEAKPPVLLKGTAHIVFTIFMLFVTVVLMNLLVGIAVQDIQGLHKTAGLDKLVRQTELIHSLELALFQGYLPNRIVSMLKSQALLTPSSYTVALNVKPLNPRETRLPKEVMLNALDIARQRRIDPHFIWASGFKNTSDEYKLLLQELHSLHDVLNEQQNTLNNIMKHMGIEKH